MTRPTGAVALTEQATPSLGLEGNGGFPGGRGGAETSREGRSAQRTQRELRHQSLEERAPSEPKWSNGPEHKSKGCGPAVVGLERRAAKLSPRRTWMRRSDKIVSGRSTLERGERSPGTGVGALRRVTRFSPSRSSAPRNWHRAAAWQGTRLGCTV